jgi:hypothetical protein
VKRLANPKINFDLILRIDQNYYKSLINDFNFRVETSFGFIFSECNGLIRKLNHQYLFLNLGVNVWEEIGLNCKYKIQSKVFCEYETRCCVQIFLHCHCYWLLINTVMKLM